jgi:hypothetical protein
VLKFQKSKKHDFTLVTAEGVVSLDEWRDILLSYDKVGATKYELYDLRRFVNTFSVEDMFFLADLGTMTQSIRPRSSKTALLVSQREGQGLSKIYNILAQARAATWETRAFFLPEEAERWLGIDLGEFGEQLGYREIGAR